MYIIAYFVAEYVLALFTCSYICNEQMLYVMVMLLQIYIYIYILEDFTNCLLIFMLTDREIERERECVREG